MTTEDGFPRRVRGRQRFSLKRTASAPAHLPPCQRPTTAAQAITISSLTGEPYERIQQLVRESFTAILPDWSGSTFAVWGGDPDDKIGAAAESLLGLQRRSGGGTAYVGPWGSYPDPARAYGPADVGKYFKQLRHAVRTRTNLGGNDLPAALRAGAKALGEAPHKENALAFVPTDGCEAVTQATHDAVAMLPPGACHLILIDPLAWCTPAMEADWRSVAFGSVTRIDDLSVRGLAMHMANIYAASIGLAVGTSIPTERKPFSLRKKITS